jgi:DNA-directed RNA polymerase specialized sigma24 family protein
MNPRHFDAQVFLDALALGGPAAERATLALLRHYRPFLRARLQLAGVAAGAFEDLISEVFFKVVTGAHKLRAAPAFHSWLTTIADNELKAHWTRLGLERRMFSDPKPLGGGDEDCDQALALLERMPDEGASDHGLRLCLQGQIARFEREHDKRYACISLIAQGFDAREIGALIGRNYGATRQFMSECCAALMSYFKPCLGDEAGLGNKRGQAGLSGRARSEA